MEDNQIKVQSCIVDQCTVNVPRDEYDDLICARFGIEMIGHSFGKYGSPDSDIVKNVCRRFGFKFEEDSDA